VAREAAMGLFHRSDRRRQTTETHRVFDQKFKTSAVRQVHERGFGLLDDVARNLRIDRATLAEWVQSDWARELQRNWEIEEAIEREWKEHGRGS
jgi:hypothetical protein